MIVNRLVWLNEYGLRQKYRRGLSGFVKCHASFAAQEPADSPAGPSAGVKFPANFFNDTLPRSVENGCLNLFPTLTRIT